MSFRDKNIKVCLSNVLYGLCDIFSLWGKKAPPLFFFLKKSCNQVPSRLLTASGLVVSESCGGNLCRLWSLKTYD